MSSSVLNLNRPYSVSIITIFFITCILVFSDTASGFEEIICPIITDIQVEGIYSITKREFLSLINVNKNHLLTKEDVRRSVKRLFQKGIFEDIVVSIKEKSDTTCVIDFKLIEKKTIKSIKIENNNHFSKSFIKKHLLIESGSRFEKKDITSSINSLQTAMRKQGFPNASVNYQVISRDSNYVDLLLDVNEGDPSVIKKIVINDESGLVWDFLPLSEGEPFNIVLLERMKEK
ncbi:MAG: hypothetical protein N2738_06845, partial [Thermodesulfovibrionales bacterium]|nr:hypothetical protein [Thermodesulfovibrionales bacterium]